MWVQIQVYLIIHSGVDMGIATDVVKLHTVCSVKQKRTANCLHIPDKQCLTKARCRRGAVLVRYQDLLFAIDVVNCL